MKLAVFASGGGSNFEALCRAVDEKRLDSTLVLCITDRQSAGVLDRAAARNIPTAVIRPRDFTDADGFADALITALSTHEVDFVVLAGYLKKVPDSIVEQYRNRIVNVHPSLLPAFGGKGMYGQRVHQAVVDYGAKLSGATVHLVDSNYDTGPVVMQEAVPVRSTDTATDLAARVLEVEHRILPRAVQLFASDRVSVNGRLVEIVEPELEK